MTAAAKPDPRQHFSAGAGAIEPPTPAQMLGSWTVRPTQRSLVWAVGCHGGAGVSTIAAQLDHVGDSGQQWPGSPDEPPFAVLVARRSERGLSAASAIGRQYLTGYAPPHVHLLGLVLVAATPRTKASDTIRRQQALVTGLFDRVWPITWHGYLLDTPLRALPTATPAATAEKKFDPTRHVAPDVLTLGRDVRDLAQQAMQHNRTHG